MLAKGWLTGVLVLAVTFSQWSAAAPGAEPSTQPALQPDRVVAIYFHRTQRCPTCRLVEKTIGEVLQKYFVQELRSGRLQWASIDFQDPRNAQFARAYQVTMPELVLVLVHDNRVVQWQPFPRVFGLLGKPQDFENYVREGVEEYLRQLLSVRK
ncbi:hypothetical protein THTE_1072 [Thermogutta terrifontis]|uniref:Thioredoxin domain-containing protein n=1 Tax=Thermogutta terrifontis TaxID=1331910 RepID=A0A286RCI2_9BACT|nr:nitrophenyl compound nitroreductase subunit ArsF family protein [Thermogutta terrifontis]ASV73674.1 hypothetical protein THTE_1072 [Thermogutta terrifontis]